VFAAVTPLNFTIGVPLLKFVPLMVTVVLQEPELGENDDKVGVGPENEL
jgi:hypothetical protein